MSTAPEGEEVDSQEATQKPPADAEATGDGSTEAPAESTEPVADAAGTPAEESTAPAEASEEAPAEASEEAPGEASEEAPAEAAETPAPGVDGEDAEAKSQPAGEDQAADSAKADDEAAASEEHTATVEGDEAPEAAAPTGDTGNAAAEGEGAEGEEAKVDAEGGDEETGKEGTEAAAEGEAGEKEAADGEGGADQPSEEKEAGDGAEGEEGEKVAAAEGEGEGAEGKAEGEADEAGEEGEAKPEAADGEGEAGERPESPVRATEKLSREATPTGEDAGAHPDRIEEVDEDEPTERPEPTTPEPEGAVASEAEPYSEGDDAEEEEEEEDDYEEEEVEEEEYNREYMITSYKQALADREQKLHQNSLLQTKLSDYFRRKKADQAAGGAEAAQQDGEKSITDQEQRYAKFVYNLEELRRTRDLKRQEFDDRIRELELECQIREEEVRRNFEELLEMKRKVGVKAVSTTNGRPFPAVTQKRATGPDGETVAKGQDLLSTSVEDMLQEEADIEDQVVKVRLENIGLANRMHKCETALKDKEELSEGLHMIDFEQLKIENQTYNEKIEERQEELLKLKKKITNNVQVLTHLKEKLQFVQSKKQEQQEALLDLDEHLAKRRDQLTRTKQARDALRNDNQRLKQNSGLLGNEALLRNFEENVDLVVEKKQRLQELKVEQADLALKCDKLKAKIREANRLQGVQ